MHRGHCFLQTINRSASVVVQVIQESHLAVCCPFSRVYNLQMLRNTSAGLYRKHACAVLSGILEVWVLAALTESLMLPFITTEHDVQII